MPAGLPTMLDILWRTGRKVVIAWVVGLGATMALTAWSIASLYDTPAKIATYAQSISGGAMYAINGKVEGINSLGGVIQDEFAFMGAFLLPLLGISLIARSTRREEEAGRLELLLAGRIDRLAPLTSALLQTWAATAVLVGIFFVVLLPTGFPTSGALLYSLSLGGLAFVFTGLAAVIAQATLHSRGVYMGSMAALVAAYVLRGVGDATGSWVPWLSPLGWQEKTGPTAGQHWWVLVLPLAAGVTLSGLALALNSRRDLGSALFQALGGPGHADTPLKKPLGFAVWLHRPSLIGWFAGTFILAVMMGVLAQDVIDAFTSNQQIADIIGADMAHPEDAFAAMVQLYIALIGMGFAIQAIGTLRREENAGRLETVLAGSQSRIGWLGTQVAVIGGGLVLIVVSASLTLGVCTALSIGSTSDIGRLTLAGVAYLPAELVMLGIAAVAFGWYPKALSGVWGYYAVVAFLAFLGNAINLPSFIVDLSPTTHVGNPPQGSVETIGLIVMACLATLLISLSLRSFHTRDIPTN